MKEKMNSKELYEAPAVLDISPVTVNVVAGTSPEGLGDPSEFNDNPGS